MPADIDERWEYWTPDPEIAEVMGVGAADGFDGLPRQKDGQTGKAEAVGFRFGLSPWRVDNPHLRLGPERVDRRLADRPERRCRQCRMLFSPKCRDQVYCRLVCATEARLLPPRTCPACRVAYKPVFGAQRFCSIRCVGADNAARWTGVPRRLDWDRIVSLYRGGAKIAHIASAVGASLISVRKALRRTGAYRDTGRRGPVRVLPDVACRWCGVTFRPRQRGQDKYCSLTCFRHADRLPPKPCPTCGNEFKPKLSRQRFCSNPCYLRSAANKKAQIDPAVVVPMRAAGMSAKEIAAKIGRSEVGVRTVLRRHRQAQQTQGVKADG